MKYTFTEYQYLQREITLNWYNAFKNYSHIFEIKMLENIRKARKTYIQNGKTNLTEQIHKEWRVCRMSEDPSLEIISNKSDQKAEGEG